MIIDLEEWLVGTGSRTHLCFPGSYRALCGHDLSDRKRPTGDERLCAKCWNSRDALATRGGL